MAGGVYWIGADGNFWIKTATSGGVKNLGAATADNPNIDVINGLDRINDPVAARAPAQTNNTSSAPSRTAAAAPGPVLNQAAVDATGKAIGSLDVERDTAYRNIDDSHRSLMGKYDFEAGRAEGDFGEQSVTNNQNLEKNKQNALTAGAQGLRGLRGVLASIGALGGTGRELANRAVTTTANEDIGGAADNFAENQGTLDKAITRFREDDKQRRAEADVQRANQRTAAEGSIAAKRQQFYQKMAELFAEGGRAGDANTWLARAGDLNNEIASKTRVAATPFTERAAAFTPGKLADYLAGAGDMTVSVSGDTPGLGPASVLAGRRRRDEERVAA